MFFSNWIVGNKEVKMIVRLQGLHEHNHTWYNICTTKRCGVSHEGNYLFSMPWSGAVLGWGGSSCLPLPHRLPLPTSPWSHLPPQYRLPRSRWPRRSFLCLFLPSRYGRRRCRRCRRCGVHKCRRGRRLGVGEASSWTSATLQPVKWWKCEGLRLNCRWWQQSKWQVTLVGDKEIEDFDGKVNRWRW